jgi:hypothetical protein
MHGTYKISNIDVCDLYLKIVVKVQFSLGNELFLFHHKNNFHFEHSENHLYILALLLTT